MVRQAPAHPRQPGQARLCRSDNATSQGLETTQAGPSLAPHVQCRWAGGSALCLPPSRLRWRTAPSHPPPHSGGKENAADLPPALTASADNWHNTCHFCRSFSETRGEAGAEEAQSHQPTMF